VRLYHATDDGPAILREGFTRCDIHEGATVAWLAPNEIEWAPGEAATT
jgi:hypothetical protein